jgi:hypothetical protein
MFVNPLVAMFLRLKATALMSVRFTNRRILNAMEVRDERSY